MKISYLYKTLLALTAMVGVSTNGYAIDAWQMVAGPDANPPLYALEINNTSSHSVNLSNMFFNSIPGLPSEMAPGSMHTFYLNEQEIRSFIYTMDSRSLYHPETTQFHCQTQQGISPFMWDFKMENFDSVTPEVIHHFHVHADICMINKCDVANHPTFSGNNGYVIVMLSDAYAPMAP